MKKQSSLLFLLFFSLTINAQFRLAKIFSNDMVFQRDVPVSVWGWTEADKAVILVFDMKEKYKTRSDENGYWKIQIPAQSAGGPHAIKVISINQAIDLTNILFGDVWLCGGQSNMEWFVEKAKDAEKELSEANYPNIRLFSVPHKIATNTQQDIDEGEWKICTSESVRQFSAVGYFFGRDLQKKLNIPIGLLNDNYGGTVVEAWTSPESLMDLPVYKKQIEKLNSIKDLEAEKNKGSSEHSKWISKFYTQDKGIVDSNYIWANNVTNMSQWPEMPIPGIWESTGEKELKDMDGVVWLAKEFNLNKEQAMHEASLSLGAIDDSDKTWINGKLVGETYNRYDFDRNYKVPKGVLKEGKNRIVIRVEDYVGGGGLYAQPEKIYLAAAGIKTSLVGNWKYQIGMITKKAFTGNVFGPNTYPSGLYYGMIAPVVNFPIKGVIWYQGESNTYRAVEYRDLFRRWIKDWRKLWHNNELPFLFVQLANFKKEETTPVKSQWAELREAQELALVLSNTAMISAIDIGEAKSIHPLNKQEVGRRLALAAQKEVYHFEDVKYKGASYSHMEKQDNYIDLFFEDTYEGLHVTNKFNYVFGFSIAAEDEVFKWAKAEIISPNQIRVWADNVKQPVAVRYSWQDNPEPANVFNSENFPLLPFRTDNWTLSTLGIVRE